MEPSIVNIIREQLGQIYDKIDTLVINDLLYNDRMIFNYLNDFKVSSNEMNVLHQQIQTQLENDGRIKIENQVQPKKLIEEIERKYQINYMK